MLKRTQHLIIAIAIFIVATLVFTNIDYMINGTLYNYGLQFDNAWWQTDQLTYMALYQILIVCLVLYTGSVPFLIVSEAFVWTSGQDFVFFGVWGGGVFPSGNWTWMSGYYIFGNWQTIHQAILSGLGLTIGFGIAYLYHHLRK